MALISDAYVVSKTERGGAIRRCPFCGALIEDGHGKDVNFIVHLGSPLVVHRQKRDWAEYVTALNRV